MAKTVKSLSQEEYSRLSPMMRQYLTIKAEHPDCIIMFRLGDFYEMFFDDAILVSQELSLTLTGRDCGLAERAPMCGVPYHAFSQYSDRLIQKGYRVAVCEQLTDGTSFKQQTANLVERKVIKVVTPGTVTNPESLIETENNYIATVIFDDTENVIGIAYSDISVGSFFIDEFSGDNAKLEMENELSRINPNEVILPEEAEFKTRLYSGLFGRYYTYAAASEHFTVPFGLEKINEHFELNENQSALLKTKTRAVMAAGALLSYFEATQLTALANIKELKICESNNFMHLDDFTRRNLELIAPLHTGGSQKSTLLSAIDKTITPMGARLMRQWCTLPLQNKDDIENRLSAVEELYASPMLSDGFVTIFRGMCDIERLCTKVAYGSVNPKNCVALRTSLQKTAEIKALLESFNAGNLKKIHKKLDPLTELCSLLENALADDPPINAKDGGVIKAGFDAKVDEYRNLTGNGKKWLNQLEEKEREQTGIKGLKIGYNRVFGYYFEVTKSNYSMVPERFIRKQTLAASERFYTEELKQLEETAQSAEENCLNREQELFNDIKKKIYDNLEFMQDNARLLSELDVYIALSATARKNSYIRPSLNDNGIISIKSCRHPMVEQNTKDAFVPNDVFLDMNQNRVLIITGPNMAGKSTYMRQTALTVLLAHIGSFVPAESADICVVDRIFTRVGASDNLAFGQSTFMVEMSEMACILNSATSKSLLILDEIGRGTATYDGLSIAWSVLEYIANTTGAKTMFATHYHELTVLENEMDCVKNYSVAIKELGDNIIFLHKIIKGKADKSFGIQVGALAGLPRAIIKRAKQILLQHEASSDMDNLISVQSATSEVLPSPIENEIISQLKALDINELSPIEAINLLYSLKKKVI